MKRIFLVDDHPMMREGLGLLIGEAGWTVDGHARSAAEALERVPGNVPDLVVLDVSLPDKNGLELTKDLVTLVPELRILVFSMHDEMLYAERAMNAGAKGYLMKGEAGGTVIHAMGSIINGGIHLSRAASKHLLSTLAGPGSGVQSSLERLTDRELEIFELTGLGKSSVEIGSQLHISPKTVDAHRANIRTKLAMPDAAALMRGAVLWIEQARSVAARRAS